MKKTWYEIYVDEINEKVYEIIDGKYKQMTAWSSSETFDLKISKKGKIFLGKKKNKIRIEEISLTILEITKKKIA